MGGTSEIIAAIGLISTICAIVFGVATFMRNKRQDVSKEERENATVLSDIGYIKSGVDDIKRRQEKQEAQYLDILTKLTSVEASAKQAHKRLDRLERSAGMPQLD